MIEKAGWRVNEPNKKTVVFESEWDGEGDLPSATKLIRNHGDCPEQLEKRIVSHYRKLQEAIKDGKHLDSYFADTKKWADVWNKAIASGAPVTLPEVFEGDLYVSGSAKLDALVKVGGYLYVYGSAKLDAPALKEVGGDLYVSGSAKLDAPKLKRKGGAK